MTFEKLDFSKNWKKVSFLILVAICPTIWGEIEITERLEDDVIPGLDGPISRQVSYRNWARNDSIVLSREIVYQKHQSVDDAGEERAIFRVKVAGDFIVGVRGNPPALLFVDSPWPIRVQSGPLKVGGHWLSVVVPQKDFYEYFEIDQAGNVNLLQGDQYMRMKEAAFNLWNSQQTSE